MCAPEISRVHVVWRQDTSIIENDTKREFLFKLLEKKVDQNRFETRGRKIRGVVWSYSRGYVHGEHESIALFLPLGVLLREKQQMN